MLSEAATSLSLKERASRAEQICFGMIELILSLSLSILPSL
jgi:hypothetical protein